MQVHIALYKWKTSAKKEAIQQAMEGIKALQDKVPGIVRISWGENTSKYSEGYTHVILVRGKDQSAIDAYRAHPDHQKVSEQIEAMELQGIGVDFTSI